MGVIALALVLASNRSEAVDLIGYLPYYRLSAQYMNGVLPQQLAMLDEVRYFGLSVGSSGQITSMSGSVASHKSNIAAIKAMIANLPESQRPRFDITLGGAGEDATFTTVAASAQLRDTLAMNVASLLSETGADAVDIDWEHPDAGVQRTTHYPALLQRVKQEVGPDRRVYATVDPTVTMPSSVLQGPHGIDGVSLMTYDLGWWGNAPGNPYAGEHSLPGYVEDSVEAWTEPPGSPNDRPWVFGAWGMGAPAEKIGIGAPFYGRDIANSTAYTYSDLATAGTTTDGAYYAYQGRTVWIPGPGLIEERVEFAHDAGLQHVIIWEIAQDLAPTSPDSLLRRAYETRQSLVAVAGDYNGDGLVDSADYDVWVSTYGSSSDLRADGNGDSVIDAADYTVWRDAASATTTAVPEAAGFWSASIAAIAAALLNHGPRVSRKGAD